jgi:hypothetical protein
MLQLGGEMAALDGHALARRLASVLWSSVADDELLTLAASGQLGKKEVLAQQVARMAKDPRGQRFIRAFVTQWLDIDHLEATEKDFKHDPSFDRSLLAEMRQETIELFSHLFENSRPVREILTAEYSFLNDKLAGFYGAPPGSGSKFVKSDAVPNRRGLLSHASISYQSGGPEKDPNFVRRGVWLSGRITCNEPPAPPPDIPGPDDSLSKEQLAKMTSKEISIYHRTEPTCASCHNVIDSLGLAMEHFDGFGRWRAKDGNGLPIDASGVYAGEAYADLPGLAVLLNEKGDFARCLDVHLTAFALGREPNEVDRCAVDRDRGGKSPLSESILDVIGRVASSEAFARQGRLSSSSVNGEGP